MWGDGKAIADVANDLFKCKIELLMKRDRLIGVLHNYKEGLLSFEDLMTAIDEYTEASNGAKPLVSGSACDLLLRLKEANMCSVIGDQLIDEFFRLPACR